MDPSTGDVLGTTSVNGRPVDGDVAPDGTVWIPDLTGGLIQLGADGAVLDQWDIDVAGPFVLDALDGHISVAEWKGTEVVSYDVS